MTVVITLWKEEDGTISGNASPGEPRWNKMTKESIIKEVSIFLQNTEDL